MAIGVAIVLIAVGLYWLRVAHPSVPEPVGNFLTEGSLFWWIYAVPGVVMLVGGLTTEGRKTECRLPEILPGPVAGW